MNARLLELQVKLSGPRDERDSTAVEYALMVALIAVVRGWCQSAVITPCPQAT